MAELEKQAQQANEKKKAEIEAERQKILKELEQARVVAI